MLKYNLVIVVLMIPFTARSARSFHTGLCWVNFPAQIHRCRLAPAMVVFLDLIISADNTHFSVRNFPFFHKNEFRLQQRCVQFANKVCSLWTKYAFLVRTLFKEPAIPIAKITKPSSPPSTWELPKNLDNPAPFKKISSTGEMVGSLFTYFLPKIVG